MHQALDDAALRDYAEQAAALLGLSIPEASWPALIEHLRRNAEAAALVMEFPLPTETEPDSRFEP